MSYRRALMGPTAVDSAAHPGVAKTTGASAADISTVIGASASGAAAILDAILGRTRTPTTTPDVGPSDTGPALPPPETGSSWVMPAVILGGAVVLGGIVLLVAGKKKPVTANRRRRVRRNGRHDPWLVVLRVRPGHEATGSGVTRMAATRAARARAKKEFGTEKAERTEVYTWRGGAYGRYK